MINLLPDLPGKKNVKDRLIAKVEDTAGCRYVTINVDPHVYKSRRQSKKSTAKTIEPDISISDAL
jgi:hypothetical protein